MALPWAAIASMINKGGETNGKQGGGFNNLLSAGKDATLSLGTGLVQKIQANKLKKQAESAMPPPVDSNQAAFLSELNQKRASLDAGTAYAAGLNNINASEAGTNNALVQAGGGNVAGTIQSLLQSKRTSEDSLNNLNAQGQQEQNFEQSAYGDMLNKIAARRLQLQMYKSQQARAEWAQKQQTASQNLMAGISRFNAPLRRNDSQQAAPSASALGSGTDSMSPMQKLGITKPVSATDKFSEAPDGSGGGAGGIMDKVKLPMGSGDSGGGAGLLDSAKSAIA